MLMTASPGIIMKRMILRAMMLLVGLLVIFVVHTDVLESLVTTTVHSYIVGLYVILSVHISVIVVLKV